MNVLVGELADAPLQECSFLIGEKGRTSAELGGSSYEALESNGHTPFPVPPAYDERRRVLHLVQPHSMRQPFPIGRLIPEQRGLI